MLVLAQPGRARQGSVEMGQGVLRQAWGWEAVWGAGCWTFLLMAWGWGRGGEG